MSLFIEVYVGSKDNKKLVAHSHAYNVSDLSDVSDYRYTNIEFGCEELDIPASITKGNVEKHNRKQSVWSLVEQIVRNK